MGGGLCRFGTIAWNAGTWLEHSPAPSKIKSFRPHVFGKPIFRGPVPESWSQADASAMGLAGGIICSALGRAIHLGGSTSHAHPVNRRVFCSFPSRKALQMSASNISRPKMSQQMRSGRQTLSLAGIYVISAAALRKPLACLETQNGGRPPSFASLPHVASAGWLSPEAAGEADRANRHDEDEPVDAGAGRVLLRGQKEGKPEPHSADGVGVRECASGCGSRPHVRACVLGCAWGQNAVAFHFIRLFPSRCSSTLEVA